MRKTTIAVALSLSLSLLLTVPAWAAAHPGEHRDDSVRSEEHGSHGHDHGHGHSQHQRPELDWSAYPADFQVFKTQLEQLKSQQKALFEQFKQQREQIRAAHDKLSEAKRKSLKAGMNDLVTQLKAARLDIRKLSEQKRTAWDQFTQHAAGKQWDAAKLDMQTVIGKKREMLARQQQLLEIQKKILERLKS